jgi:Set1/Ash2 histone methyltransferase complex subunit ASH2
VTACRRIYQPLTPPQDVYRYILAEHDPFDAERFRPVRSEDAVQFSIGDRAPQLKLSDDGLTATGDKGYCMCRATHGLGAAGHGTTRSPPFAFPTGVGYGTWYWEMTLLEGDPVPEVTGPYQPVPHARLGIAQKYGGRWDATAPTSRLLPLLHLISRLATLQVPCGYDAYSYSWRDSPGSKFHRSKGLPYGGEGTRGYWLAGVAFQPHRRPSPKASALAT